MSRAAVEISAQSPAGSSRAAAAMSAPVGYILPEFPGQTHIWMWREIEQLREWDVPLRIFSTRPPPERDRARHAFAKDATAETTYLWPMGVLRSVAAVLWAVCLHPAGVCRCVGLAFSLPINKKYRVLRLLALIVPGCILARECARSGVRHMHSHSCANAAILCMMVKRLLGVPFSMTLNANIEWWGGAMRQKFEDAAFTVAITQWLLAQMKRDFPTLAPDQAILGRIGVNTRRWTPDPRKPSPDGRVRLITVARLHVFKGHATLLDAVSRLDKAGLKLHVRIVGDGPERENLVAQIDRLGLRDSVTLLGSLSEDRIIDLMRESDVFVLPSKAEPLGVAYMEAMAMEVAAVGTNAGGVTEIITPGEDGLLVPPGDSAALADAIRTLAADETVRTRIGEAGRRKIVEFFDSRVGAGTLYERLLHEPSPHAAGRDRPA